VLVITQVVAQLGLQAPFEDPLDHLRQEPALTGQPQSTVIDTGHQVIEQPGLDHLIDGLTRSRQAPAWARRTGSPGPVDQTSSSSYSRSSPQFI
jgi:hypothetical protein